MLDLFSDNQYWKPPLPDISVDIQYLPVQNQNKTKDNNVHHNDVACTKATELLVVENCYCSQLNLSDQSNKKNQYMMAPCGLYYHSANPESNSSSLYTEDSLHTSSQKKPNELFKRKCAYCVTAAKFQGNNNNSNNNSNALELISRASTKSAKSDTLQLNPSYDRLLSVKSTCGKSMGNTESNNGRRYNLITSGKSKGHSHNKRSLQTSGRSKSLSTKRKELQITDDGFCLTTKSSRLLDRVKSEDEITFEVVPESKKSSKPQSHVKSLLSNEHEEISTEQRRRLEDVAKEVVNSVVVDAEVNMLVGGPSPVLYDGGTPCYCNMAQRSLVDVSTNSTFSGETLLNWLLCGGKYKDNCNDVFVTEFCQKLLKCGILRTQTNIPGAKFNLNGLYRWFEPTQRYKSTSEPNLEQLPSEPKNMKRNSLPSEKQQRLPTTVQSKLNSYISVADLSSITTTSPNEGFRNNSNRLKTNIDQSSIATQTEVSFSELKPDEVAFIPHLNKPLLTKDAGKCSSLGSKSCSMSPPPPPDGALHPPPPPGGAPPPSPPPGGAPPPPPPPGGASPPSPPPGGTPPPPPPPGGAPPPPPPPGGAPPPPPPPGGAPHPPPPPGGALHPLPQPGGALPPPPPPGGAPPPPPPQGGAPPPPPPPGGAPPPPPPPGGAPLPPLPPGGAHPPPPGGAPPPPPPPGGAPPPPPPPGGAPPPPPSPGGAVTPFKPMKPLYWIRLNQSHSNQTIEQKKTLWENVEVVKLDEVDLVNLFAKTSSTKQKKPLNTTIGQKKKKKEKFGKVLDLKRSQAVGIFISSLHIDVDDIQNAILTLDTSIVDVEIMEAIWEIRPQLGEMEKIEHFVGTQKKVDEDQRLSLDRPEEFLYKLWQIPDLSHRLFCITFMSRFDQDVSHVTQTIALINDVCKTLRGDVVKKLLSIILSVGNYLNGGNVSRGQARGFDLEILGKLKDVKSNVGGVTLLSYIVSLYIRHFKQDNDLETWKAPVPDTLSLMRASQVKYEDICGEITKLKTKLNDCRLRVKKVVENEDNKYVEPFREKMTDFVDSAYALITNKEKEISDSKISFESMLHYFNCGCGKSKIKQPKDFFDMWIPFSVYFSEVWPVQIRAEVKKQKSEAATKVDELRSVQVVRTRTRKRCLKKRLAGQLPDQ